MRKLFILIIFIALFLALQLNGFYIATKNFDGKYSIYTENERIEKEYNLSFNKAISKKITEGNIKGESIRFIGNDEDIKMFISSTKLKIVDRQKLANNEIIYGYNQGLNNFVILNGEKVNVQIAKKGATIIIGTPLIFGSY